MKYHIVFVGNPNVGKSAWINALSNANFKVGNWGGVTVEKKEAFVNWEGKDIHIIDLPGTHSLEKSVNEENITAQYLRHEQIDLIVNVVDATNLANNLLLTLCLRELQLPMIVIFNFMDEVEKYHMRIDMKKISRRLQLPIYPYSAYDTAHYDCIKQAILEHMGQRVWYYPLLSKADEEVYVALYNMVDAHVNGVGEEELHRIIMGYLKGDVVCEKQLATWSMDMEYLAQVKGNIHAQSILAHHYEVIDSLMRYVEENQECRYHNTRKIDGILLHRLWGLPIFLLLFSILLIFVFKVSAPFNEFISYLIGDVATRYIYAALQWLPTMLQELVCKGIVAGVGGVLTFIPLMALLYFMLSLLEESGYMSRISFLLDRAMRLFHLSGKSFVSLLLGFGCNVPAIYATRTLDNEKQKRLTAILVPFMSCGARLPVYVLFASAFFPQQAGVMMLCVYGLGILFALLFALIFSHTSYMKDDAMYVQELPPYRLPSMRVILHKVKEEVRGYVKKATGIVLWAMILLWGCSYFPSGNIETSYIATASKALQPIFEPLGFGNRWESIASLPGGIIAKETIVGYFEQVIEDKAEEEHMGIHPLEDGKQILYHAKEALVDSVKAIIAPHIEVKSESDVQVSHIRSLWQDRLAKLRAFCFMVYVLLSIPCVMSLQAMYHEVGWKLTLLSISTMMIVPYLSSFLLFQIFSRIL